MRICLKDCLPGDTAGTEQQYELPNLGLISISDALQYIAQTHDARLGYYLSCRRGLCACCTVRVDGEIAMACVTPVKDGMVVEPYRKDLVVVGTVVDLSMTRKSRFEFANGEPCACTREGDTEEAAQPQACG